MLQTTGAFLTRGRCPGVEVSGASGPRAPSLDYGYGKNRMT